ncbi:hypothetical protein CC1G_13083 [Coprinopsis cinerea okayama7|uniref:Uncharacterized protein n=1 Tax=Coprinopsis cinerea (strain Okayama-7 / 130 / ATCC MYA-4618 / FGSC 9003) TaxID=240176 RepID=A8NME4_COPC7|nr:hypothetical protein CC1G_13083 [Coprinopsis cinerea okayama7\|eukprot:XP_001834899.2 hypothetical protein CC1G_13083 [Coprinopsis cinerea okayama7\
MLFRRKCASESASPQSSPVKANGEAPVKAKYADVILEDYEVGIWRVLLSKTSGFRLKSFEQQAYFYKSLPHIRRLYMTAWLLSPALVLFYSFSSLWSGIEDAIQMYLSNEILRAIESGIVEKKPIATELFKAAVLRILCMLLISYIGRSKWVYKSSV